MICLLRYEWKKFLYNKKNWIVLVLILASFIGYVSFHVYENQAYMDTKKEEFSKYRQSALYDITNMANYQSLSKTDKEKEYYANAIEYFKEVYDCANTLYQEYASSSLQLDHLMNWNALMIQGKDNKINIVSYTRDTMEELTKMKREYQYIKKNHISIKKTPYVCTTSNLIMNLTKNQLGFVVLILFFLWIYDVFNEFDSGAYKVLYSSGYDFKKILCSKILFSVFLLIGYILLFIILFGVNSCIFGIGNLEYPFSIGTRIYPESTIIIRILLLIFGMNVFLIGVYTCISILFKSTTRSLVIMTLLYFAVNLFQSNLKTISNWIGFLGPNLFSMLQQKNILLTLATDMFVLIVLLIGSTIILKKQDLIVGE